MNSELANECQRTGIRASRKTLENGYDLEKEATVNRLKAEMRAETPPKRGWFSLKCTEWTNIQNINQRTPQQIEALRRRRQRARKMARNALSIIEDGLEHNRDFLFYWEWPKSAFAGWNLDEMKAFEERMRRKGIRLYWTEMHGCMFDLRSPEGELLNKAWYIMTNDMDFNHHCRVCCDRSHTYREGGVIGSGSKAVEATAFYPKKMIQMTVKQWRSKDERMRRQGEKDDVKGFV